MLQVGDVAPDFILVTVDGRSVSLTEVRQKGQVILLETLKSVSNYFMSSIP
jgi:peroxiredoxin